LIAGVFVLVAGVIVTRWVRTSAGRLSVVAAPLVFLGGLALAPSFIDPCASPTTTIVPSTTTIVPSTTTIVPSTTTIVPSTTTTVPSATTTTVPSTTTTVPSATTTTVPSATTTTVASTTTTTTTTTTTLAPVVYQVGGAGPSGGIVFYDAGSVQSWGRYLEVACAGWSDGTCGGNDLTDPFATWGCSGTSITGADGTAIGTGGQNTTDITAIVNGCQTSGIAARLANDLTLGGQSDWFLPSKDELNQMYINLHSASTPLGGFSTDYYWSSSEFADIFADGQNFVGGGQNNGGKTNLYRVRPVRAF
jgi:hypothetical protein